MILSYIAGSLALIVFGILLMITQLGFLLAFVIIAVIITAIIAACIALYAFITRMRNIAGGFG